MNCWRCFAKTQRTQRGMCLARRRYGGDWGLAGKQAFRADMGRHSVLRTSYLRKICRSYGAWEDAGIEMDYT